MSTETGERFNQLMSTTLFILALVDQRPSNTKTALSLESLFLQLSLLFYLSALLASISRKRLLKNNNILSSQTKILPERKMTFNEI